MTDTKKPRGRPKSPATIENERIEAMFKNKPSHIKDQEDGFTSTFDYEHAKQIAAELIADFPRTVPHDLIFAVNSHFEDPEDEVKVQILMEQALAAATAGQFKGGNALRQNAISKAHALWNKNQDLITKMQTPGLADFTAKLIIQKWDTRGLEGNPPSPNTIKNWFKQYTSN
jgi:hypothetical protein